MWVIVGLLFVGVMVDLYDFVMCFDKFDLNLLVVFDVLLQECGVLFVVDWFNFSQLVVSGVLVWLCDYFRDDLLVVCGCVMVLILCVEMLVELVCVIIDQICVIILMVELFDFVIFDCMLLIMVIDYIFEILLRLVIVVCVIEVLGVCFELVLIVEYFVEVFQCGWVDILIGIDNVILIDYLSEFFYIEDFVIVGWCDNFLLVEVISLEWYE